MKWNEVEFGEVAEIITGNTPSTKKQEYYQNGTIPFVSPADLGSKKIIISTKKNVTKLGLEVSRELPENAVMLCCIGATIGKVGITGKRLITNQQINSFVFDENRVDYRYAYHYCTTLKDTLKGKSHSTTLPIVSKGKLSKIKIPLPPLLIQKKIATILDAADDYRQKTKALLDKYDELTQSIFLDMFGDPVRNEKGWEVKTLGEVIHDSRLGKMLDKKNQTGLHLKRYLGNSNVKWFHFDLENLKSMDFTPKEQIKFNLTKGDVLVCEGGEVGRCAIWNNDLNDCYFQKAIHRIRVNRNFILPIYLSHFLKMSTTQNGFVAL